MIDPVELFRKSMAPAMAAHNREIADLVKQAKSLEVWAASLRDGLMALLPPTVATDEMPNGGQPRKRKPTTASMDARDKVFCAMRDINQPIRPKQLHGATGLGSKTICAVLRLFVEQGRAVSLPGGKWALSAVTAANLAMQDGIDAEVGSKD